MKFELPEVTRCCLCLPLRRGVLVLGYIQFITAVLGIALYSYTIHKDIQGVLLLKSSFNAQMTSEVCLIIYLIDFIFCLIFIYGVHKEILQYVKIFYQYTIMTSVASLLIQIIEIFDPNSFYFFLVEIVFITACSIIIQLYVIILLKSLIIKMERKGPHSYENQLNQFVTCDEVKIDGHVDNIQQ